MCKYPTKGYLSQTSSGGGHTPSEGHQLGILSGACGISGRVRRKCCGRGWVWRGARVYIEREVLWVSDGGSLGTWWLSLLYCLEAVWLRASLSAHLSLHCD